MKGFLLRGSIIVAIVCLVSLLPCLLIYYLGYNDKVRWNDTCIHTDCLIKNHSYIFGTNCRNTCYDALIALSYNDTFNDTFNDTLGTNYINNVTVYRNRSNYSAIVTDLHTIYPIGGKVTCYYSPKDPNDVAISFRSAETEKTFIIFFVIIGFLFLFCWLTIETIIHIIENGCPKFESETNTTMGQWLEFYKFKNPADDHDTKI